MEINSDVDGSGFLYFIAYKAVKDERRSVHYPCNGSLRLREKIDSMEKVRSIERHFEIELVNEVDMVIVDNWILLEEKK